MKNFKMKFPFILAGIAMLGSLPVFAEEAIDKFSESFCRVRQIPGTEAVMTNYFSGTNLTDTTYCIIYPVGNCFRCEATINPIYDGLKNVEPDKSIVLVSVLPDSIAARNYRDRFGFKSDFDIYDNEDKYKKFLSFDTGSMHIPYVLKILPLKGELLVGCEHFSTSEFFHAIAQCHNPKQKQVFPLSMKIEGKFMPSSDELVFKNSMPLIYESQSRLAKSVNPVCFVDDRLLITDDLEMRPVIFDLERGEGERFMVSRFLEPDSVQKKQFSEIDDEDFKLMSKSLRYMAISPTVLPDGTSAAAYSLPKLWYEGERDVAYMNQACFIKEIEGQRDSVLVIPFGINPWGHLFYKHFVINNYGKDIAIACERLTWPLDFEKEEYINTPENNPFDDRFYDSDVSTMAVFDVHTGALKKHIGRLPEMARKTKTGYYYMKPVTGSYGEDVVYTDGFTGKIHVFDSSSDERLEDYDIFNIPDSIVPAPDETKFYTVECLEEYNKLFNRCVVSMALTDEFVYCMVKYNFFGINKGNEDYSVVRINRHTGEISERSFPKKECGMKYYYALRKHSDGREPEPTAIIGDNGRWNVEIYSFESSE